MTDVKSAHLRQRQTVHLRMTEVGFLCGEVIVDIADDTNGGNSGYPMRIVFSQTGGQTSAENAVDEQKLPAPDENMFQHRDMSDTLVIYSIGECEISTLPAMFEAAAILIRQGKTIIDAK